MTTNPKVDLYLTDGCGRCQWYATDKCKVRSWQQELVAIRSLMLETGLTEDLKWGVPVYTFNEKNVVMVGAFKEYCSISFYKGVLLKDKKGILQKQGENGQSVRIYKCTNLEDVERNRKLLKTYVDEAIAIEKAGWKVEKKSDSTPLPVELENIMNKHAAFKKAFYSLTPGRQRGYLIYFNQPKQSKTIISRIENSMDNIMNGIGLHDR